MGCKAEFATTSARAVASISTTPPAASWRSRRDRAEGGNWTDDDWGKVDVLMPSRAELPVKAVMALLAQGAAE